MFFYFYVLIRSLFISSGRSVGWGHFFRQFHYTNREAKKKSSRRIQNTKNEKNDNYGPNNDNVLKQAYQTLVVQLLDNIPCFSRRPSDERFLVRSTLQGLLSHFSHDVQLLEEIGALVFRILVWSNDSEDDLRGDD